MLRVGGSQRDWEFGGLFLSTRLCVRCFPFIIFFGPLNSPMKQWVLFPLYRWRSWGSESWAELLNVTWPIVLKFKNYNTELEFKSWFNLIFFSLSCRRERKNQLSWLNSVIEIKAESRSKHIIILFVKASNIALLREIESSLQNTNKDHFCSRLYWRF